MVKRNPGLTALGLALALGGAGACNWTTFDDLAQESWVDRVVKPNNSRQYGQVVVAMPNPTEGGGAKMIVLGRASASLSTLNYDASGKRTINSISDFVSLGFALFPENPPVVVEPGMNRFAFPVITGTMEEGQGRVIIMDGDLGGSPPLITFTAGDATVQKTRIGALAFGTAKLTRPPLTAPPTDPAPILVVGRGAEIDMVVDYDTAVTGADAMWGCSHGNSDNAVFGAAVADVLDDGGSSADDDNEIIVGIGPKDRDMPMSELRIYSPDQLRGMSGSGTTQALSPCVAPLEVVPVAAADAGAAITTAKFDPASTLTDVVYSAPSINKVFVRLGDLGVTRELTITNIGSEFGYALAAGNLDDDPEPELVVGAPRSNVDGETDAGAIYVYDYDSATDEFTQTTMYTTSSPSASEKFGKTVAIAPWDATRNILVVGAEGKVFTYFRTGLYDDVRTGR